jgi:GNAT superfamily N-acetyltransferase
MSGITVRTLDARDGARLVRIDEAITGRRRQAWFEGRLKRALAESDLVISLGAEIDGLLVGAMLGSLHYGEFGRPEPVAELDTVLVDRAFSRRGVAKALLRQLAKNMRGLRIERIRTQVEWSDAELLGFFAHSGFAPVPRLVLEMDVSREAASDIGEEDAASLGS